MGEKGTLKTDQVKIMTTWSFFFFLNKKNNKKVTHVCLSVFPKASRTKASYGPGASPSACGPTHRALSIRVVHTVG